MSAQVDKWLFLRFYRIPPQYGTELGASHTERLPYGILLHLAIGVWMLGNASIFQTAAVRLAEVEASASFSDACVARSIACAVAQLQWYSGTASAMAACGDHLHGLTRALVLRHRYIDLAWGERVSQRHVLPMFLVLVGVLAVRSPSPRPSSACQHTTLRLATLRLMIVCGALLAPCVGTGAAAHQLVRMRPPGAVPLRVPGHVR